MYCFRNDHIIAFCNGGVNPDRKMIAKKNIFPALRKHPIFLQTGRGGVNPPVCVVFAIDRVGGTNERV